MELYLIKTISLETGNGSKLKDVELDCDTKVIADEKEAREYFESEIEDAVENYISYVVEDEEDLEDPDYFDEDGYGRDGYTFKLVKDNYAEVRVWDCHGDGALIKISLEKIKI